MKRIAFFLTVLTFLFSIQSFAQTSEEKISDTLNKTDSYGNKTGFWIEKEAGIIYKGEYAAGKKVKSWVGYYPSNLIYKVEFYDNGLKDGVSLQFDKHGKVIMVENYRNGVLHGPSFSYGNSGDAPMSETDYANGKRNGVYRLYYDNAKIQEESWFKDGAKNGVSRWHNKSGQKIAEYNYKMGNFDGIQKTFYENDTLQSVSNYTDNVLHGESKEFYRNGKVKISGNYVLGQKDGPWTEYDELGKVEKVVKFKNGVEAGKKK